MVSLFRSKCQLILYLTTMYVYCAYSAIWKSQKQLPICLQISETSVFLIVFNGVTCAISSFTATVSFCRSTWITYHKCFIRSMTKQHCALVFPLYQYSILHNCRMQFIMKLDKFAMMYASILSSAFNIVLFLSYYTTDDATDVWALHSFRTSKCRPAIITCLLG